MQENARVVSRQFAGHNDKTVAGSPDFRVQSNNGLDTYSMDEESEVVNMFSKMNATQKQNRKAMAQETERMLTTMLQISRPRPMQKLNDRQAVVEFLVGTQGL